MLLVKPLREAAAVRAVFKKKKKNQPMQSLLEPPFVCGALNAAAYSRTFQTARTSSSFPSQLLD